MLVATILIAALVSIAALAWVVWPLLNRAPAPLLVEDDRFAELLARKDSVVMALKDLEFDYNVGKLSDEDYERYEQRLRRQAIGYLQQIEQIAPASTELDAGVEAEIARHRRVTVAAPAEAAPVREAIPAVQMAALGTAAVRAPATNGSAGRFCTNCGSPIAAEHRFCAGCGTPVLRQTA